MIFTRCDKVAPGLGTTNFLLLLLLLLLPISEFPTGPKLITHTHFSVYIKFSEFNLIFKITFNFQNYIQFSKLHPIFKITSNFQNYIQFSKYNISFPDLLQTCCNWLFWRQSIPAMLKQTFWYTTTHSSNAETNTLTSHSDNFNFFFTPLYLVATGIRTI
jgi:hypothetical protein